MKKTFAILLAVLGFSAVSFAGSFPEISLEDLKSAIAQKTVSILDVNGTESYKSGHIPGAIDYSAVKTDLATKLPKDKASLVVAYCGGEKCLAYAKAAQAAKDLGYTNVKHFKSGLKGWKAAGEPLEK